MNPGDRVKITKDRDILEKYGLEALLEESDIFNNIYTIQYKSYGWYTLEEAPVNQYDWHPDCLILQK